MRSTPSRRRLISHWWRQERRVPDRYPLAGPRLGLTDLRRDQQVLGVGVQGLAQDVLDEAVGVGGVNVLDAALDRPPGRRTE
jgi:hypothetical protein